jgi:PAS domain S-box-containing protein
MDPNDPFPPSTQALHEAEARFRSAFDNAAIGMAISDTEGRFLEVNAALCDIVGRSEAELLASSWRDITHPDDLDAQIAFEQNALQARARSFHQEKRYVHPDGRVVWTLLSRSLVTDPQGRPRYFISQVQDITARKRVEEALQAREEETRRILETAQDAFIGMDAEGRINDWNRQAEVIFGWPRDQALGRSLAETIIPPRYREAHHRGLKRFMETGEGPVLNRRLELSAVRQGGEEFPVELTIWVQPSGGAVRFNALVHDISKRKQVEDRQRRQTEELAALYETTLGLINRLEPTSLLEAILVRAGALMGTPHAYLYVVEEGSDELVVRAGIGVFTERVGYRLRRGQGLAGRVWKTGQPVTVDDYRMWSGRRPGWDEVRAAVGIPLRSGTEVVGVLGVVVVEGDRTFGPSEVELLGRFGQLASLALENARLYSAAQQELTERRRTEKELERTAAELMEANEELRAADELKSHFVAVASHELRTPLTSVLGFASTLRRYWDQLDDEDKRGHVSTIEEQARRLSRLADDMLTVSRIEAGALDVRTEEVDLRRAAVQAAVSFGEEGSGLSIEVPDGLRAMADPDHVHQILTNFLSNALKYGAPPMTVEGLPVGGHVELRVRDRGDGVPEAFVPRLFEKFAQARRGAGQPVRGTGLGLSIVRGLARAQGGDAWYEAGSQTGACFVVRLPRAGD